MPAPTQCDEFLDAIRESGVVEDKRLDSFLGQRTATSSFPEDPRGLAEEMIQAGLITAFQKDLLLQGKRRGFVLADKYILLGHLGSGGMGTVYLCEHKVMRRRVALKVLPPSLSKDPEYLDRFHREARAAAALDHPNIVRAHDAGSDGKMHFLVMEYIEGASLHEIVSKEGRLDIQQSADYICQAATGLEHAHEAGLVHRDIKPGNLLVDRKGTLKILDMGLALFFQERESLTKQYDAFAVLGTADFLAPEQAVDSHAVDIRADIYSLGLTFFFLLTGKNIYGDGTIAQKLLWHQMREVKSIREFRPEVPEGLAAIISKMIAKDRADRYQTPRELIEALTPWARGTALTAAEKESVPPGPTAQASELTQTNGEELTLQEFPSSPTVAPASGSGKKGRVPPLADALAALQPVTAPASDRKAPAEMRTAKTSRAEKPDLGSKRAKSTKVGRITAEPDSKPTLNSKGPRTPAKTRREKPASFWSEHGLVVGGVGGGLCLILALVAAIGFNRRSGPVPSSSENPPPANTSEATVATATSPEKSPDAKVPPASRDANSGEALKTLAKSHEPPKTDPKPSPPKPAIAPPMVVAKAIDPPKTVELTPKPAPASATNPKPPPATDVKKEPQPLADYFPTAGHTLQYDVVTNIQGPKGIMRQVTREKWEYKEGTAERTVLGYGELEGNSLLKGGVVKWKAAATPGRRLPDKFNYRNHKGYVEFGVHVPVKQLNTTQPTTQLIWEPVLPLSGAEGYSWDLRSTSGDKVLKKYTIVKFDQFRGQPSVIVRDSFPAALPDAEIVTYHTFVKGIGEVERTINLEAKGAQPQLAGEWKLVE